MPLAQRKRVILAKLESTYGIDSAPGVGDAILCSGLDITPLEGSSVERDFIRPFFGSSGSIRVENFASLSFDTEIAGSGVLGTPPPWGSLLKACNFTETILASPTIATAQAGGSTTTIKLAASTPGVDDLVTGMTIDITAGTGSGQTGEIISYVSATKIATIAKPWAIAPDATSQYSIGANVIYTPNSNFGTASANTSASIYFNVDGVRHVLLGARGSVSFDMSVKAIPKMKWKFTGLLGTISDAALPAGVFSSWQTPVTVSSANTSHINLLGYNGAVIQTLAMDIANQVIYRQLIGAESVLITDRKPTGSITFEATTVTAKDWWTLAKTAGTGPFCVKHGTIAGNIVGFTAQKAQLADPKYSDSEGVTMMDFSMMFIPYGASGNDDIRICCK